jgi:cbb3-type cytochrome oxidase subunit 3
MGKCMALIGYTGHSSLLVKFKIMIKHKYSAGARFMGNLKYLIFTLSIIWCLMLLLSFSSLTAINVFRYASSRSAVSLLVSSILALSALPALLLRMYLKKRYRETKGLPPLVVMISFFAVNYFYASYWGLLSFETAITMIRSSLIITLITFIALLLIYHIYRQRRRRVEDYIAEVFRRS